MICLILTLPMCTAIGELAFSAIKIVKTRLRNKMEDKFHSDNLAVYIEKEIAKNFTSLLTQYLMTLDPLKIVGYNFEQR